MHTGTQARTHAHAHTHTHTHHARARTQTNTHTYTHTHTHTHNTHVRTIHAHCSGDRDLIACFKIVLENRSFESGSEGGRTIRVTVVLIVFVC